MRARRPRSSLIERIAFDEASETLTVWLRGRGKYLYHAVPRAVFDAFGAAASAGRFFNEQVKGRFACSFDPERRRHRPG